MTSDNTVTVRNADGTTWAGAVTPVILRADGEEKTGYMLLPSGRETRSDLLVLVLSVSAMAVLTDRGIDCAVHRSWWAIPYLALAVVYSHLGAYAVRRILRRTA